MQEREEIVSTYLGNGISLPHGTNESKEYVLRTGLAVAQFPDGVPWGDQPAHLVIGLAATSDEHLKVLARLGTILGDEDLCRRLGSTLDAAEIHRALTAPEADAPSGNGHRARSDDIARELKITNPHGLHARPAATVVDRMRPFGAEVAIRASGRKANARSTTPLLGLGAAMGDDVRIVARGADAQSATDAIAAILTSTTEG